MDKNNCPIGIFDSGLGGISIYNALTQLLPQERFIYLADSENAPYGNKTQKKIRELSHRNTEFLVREGAKCIVVACNTATTQTIQYLRKQFDVPFIGVEPAIKPAARYSVNKKIGVLATEGTLRSNLFQKTFNTYGESIEAVIQVGAGLVELIEQNKHNSKEIEELLSYYINPMLSRNIDVLVLGCTHYPFLIPAIDKMTEGNVKVFEPSHAVARQTENVLTLHKISRRVSGSDQKKIEDEFYTTGNPQILKEFLLEHSPYHCQSIKEARL